MSAAGIEVRHGRSCPVEADAAARCRCKPGPSYRASVWSRRDGKRMRKTFPTLASAKAWRADASGAVRRGERRAPDGKTLRQAAEEWLARADEGIERTRSGAIYKPSTVRSYRDALRLRIHPALGARKLADVTRGDVNELVDRMLGDGLDASTIRNTIAPLRVIYRRAIDDGDLSVNPCERLRLPVARGRRDRIAAPEEAARLLAVLPENDRALWATALYGGLRRGELMALAWENIDLDEGVIRVDRSYDPKEHAFITPKSKAGTRTVPIPKVLRAHLAAHQLRTPWAEGLAFGRTAGQPFEGTRVNARAGTAWKNAQPKPLDPIGLHECRHTFASLMIAAGVNVKALSSYMGHSSVTLTWDRYGHLFPGNEEEAAGLLDAFLDRADTAARLACLTPECGTVAGQSESLGSGFLPHPAV